MTLFDNLKMAAALAVVTMLSIGGPASSVSAQGLPPISGMVKLSDTTYLAVTDAKAGAPGDTGERLYLATVPSSGTPSTAPIPCDWSPLQGELPNDLESVVALPGMPNRFVAVESSYHEAKYGRLLELSLQEESGAWSARVEQVQHFPRLVPGTDVELDNIEGCVAIAGEKETWLLLGKRGKNEKDAWLLAGRYESGAAEFVPTITKPYFTPFRALSDVPGDHRYCGDLALVGSEIYASSCNDPGDDGPYTSAIYKIGSASLSDSGSFVLDLQVQFICNVPHHKIEAVVPMDLEHHFLCASDDENAGGAILAVTGTAAATSP